MKKNIPNFFTLLNLIIGLYCVINSFNNQFSILPLFYVCLLLDFFDGLIARKLNVISEFGKQLDSFADFISFGGLPSIVLYIHLEKTFEGSMLLYTSFLILICSAIRLAKFNLSNKKSNQFYGLPTPANALFFVSLVNYNGEFSKYFNDEILVAFILIFSFLMISNIRFISLKFINFSFKDNVERYFLLMITIILLSLQGHEILFLVVLIYVIFNIFKSIFSFVFSNKS